MLFSLLASILAFGFCVVIVQKWVRNHQPFFAAWACGLFIFGVAAAFQAAGQAEGFSSALFRGFYLFGGVLGVIYLALGTVFLLFPKAIAKWSAIVLIVLTAIMAVDALVIPVNTAVLGTPAGVLGGAITGHGNPLYIGAVVFNIVGSLILVGGSGWSAIHYMRQHSGLDRVICNVLLTIGAFIIASGFSAAKTVGLGLTALGIYECVGIALMFIGFLSLGRIGIKQNKSLLPKTERI